MKSGSYGYSRSRSRPAVGGVLLVLAALLTDPGAGLAQEDTLQVQIRNSQERLQEIRAEREQLREAMEALQGQARDLSRELQIIERQVDASAEALQELDYQTAALAASVDETTQRLVQTRDRLQERNVVLKQRLRAIYKRGPLHAVRVLLSAENFADLLNRYKYLHLISVHDRLLLYEIVDLEQRLTAQEETLQRNLAQIEELRAEKLSEFAQLQYLERSRIETLRRVRQRVGQAEGRIQQLEEDERRLTDVVARLERERLAAERRRAAAGLAAGSGSLEASDLGRLPWPVEGDVVYNFGPEQRPNGVTLRRNGIGIAADPGTAVRAVRSGTVMVAGAMEGFGNGVVINHGSGYYTLYMYLADVRVLEGQDVTTGQVLGTVGAGPEEGPHLYLQIRAPVGGTTPIPVDPLPWLQPRR